MGFHSDAKNTILVVILLLTDAESDVHLAQQPKHLGKQLFKGALQSGIEKNLR